LTTGKYQGRIARCSETISNGKYSLTLIKKAGELAHLHTSIIASYVREVSGIAIIVLKNNNINYDGICNNDNDNYDDNCDE
jgi:hypothetical protein